MQLIEKYKALFLAHIDSTPLFELGKEAFACLGILFSLIILINLISSLKNAVKPTPPKQFFQ